VADRAGDDDQLYRLAGRGRALVPATRLQEELAQR